MKLNKIQYASLAILAVALYSIWVSFQADVVLLGESLIMQLTTGGVGLLAFMIFVWSNRRNKK